MWQTAADQVYRTSTASTICARSILKLLHAVHLIPPGQSEKSRTKQESRNLPFGTRSSGCARAIGLKTFAKNCERLRLKASTQSTMAWSTASIKTAPLLVFVFSLVLAFWLTRPTTLNAMPQYQPMSSLNLLSECQPKSRTESSRDLLLAAMRTARAERDNPTRQWWMATSHHRTHKNLPLDFSRHCYLVDIYQDAHPNICIRKSTQSGVSEFEWCWAMAKCDDGQAVFWVFPTEQLRNQLVHDRFDRIVGNTDYYANLALASRKGRKQQVGADAVSLKQFGRGSIALVPSNSVVSFKSFSADHVIVDELDQCDQENLPMIDDRLAHSDYRTKLRVGNPSISGYGIDALYGQSDQRVWKTKCEDCGEWQSLDWFVNVVEETSEGIFTPRKGTLGVYCRACGHSLDRHAPGEWVSTYPDRMELRGYTISQLFSGSVTLQEMFAAFQRGLANETEKQRFYNSVLGLPYVAEGNKLTEARLRKATGEHPRQSVGQSCFMGIDVGALLHCVVIDSESRVLALFTCRQFDEVDNAMKSYGVAMAVCDMLPETREARQFAQRHRGRVLLCQFVASEQVKDFAVDYSQQIVKAHRTQTMDDSHAAIMQCKAMLPADASSVPDFYSQMMAPTRIFDEKRQTFRWEEGSQPDHYRHSFNYAWLAKSIRSRHGAGVVTL